MRFTLLVFQIIAFGLHSFANTICDDASLRHSLETPSNSSYLEDFIFEHSIAPRLVMFGEIHYYTSPSLLVNLINSFVPQMREKKCLFLEFSSDVDPYELISTAEQALASLPDGPSLERTEITKVLNYYKPLVTAAEKNG